MIRMRTVCSASSVALAWTHYRRGSLLSLQPDWNFRNSSVAGPLKSRKMGSASSRVQRSNEIPTTPQFNSEQVCREVGMNLTGVPVGRQSLANFDARHRLPQHADSWELC